LSAKAWAAIFLCGQVLLGGCSSTASPRESAYLTLFGANGELDTKAFQAALEARFPSGSPLPGLLKYVGSMHGGWCSTPAQDGNMSCEATIETCSYVLHATAIVEGQTISRIQFKVGQIICD
jgi:hypothetical protein